MLETLRLVRGAVSSKDLVPMLTHFCVYDGRIQGANGFLCIDAICPGLEGDFAVPAERFLKAVDACAGEPKIVTDAGKVIVSRGKFRAKMASHPRSVYPAHDEPERTAENAVALGGDIIAALRAVRDFIGVDASRRWSMSAKAFGGWLYATNNVSAVRVPLDTSRPVVFPSYLIDELLRNGVEPDATWATEHYIACDFPGWWVRASFAHDQWPDIDQHFDRAFDGAEIVPVPPGLLDAVEMVAPLSSDLKAPEIWFADGKVTTPDGDHAAEVEGFDLPEGRYRLEPLRLALKHAHGVDFTRYPGAIPFTNDDIGLQGVFVGVR
jgi:hypothetical protein